MWQEELKKKKEEAEKVQEELKRRKPSPQNTWSIPELDILQINYNLKNSVCAPRGS